MVQYCYLTLHVSTETVSCCLLQRWELEQVYARDNIHATVIKHETHQFINNALLAHYKQGGLFYKA